MAVTPEKIVVMYFAMKCHFNVPSYDYLKYSGKVKNRNISKRDHPYYIAKKIVNKYGNARLKEVEETFLANFLEVPNFWIGDFFTEPAMDRYKKWKRATNSIENTVRKDFHNILSGSGYDMASESFDELFSCEGEGYPKILKALMQKEITLETFMATEYVLGFLTEMNKNLKDDFIWQDIYKRCLKYFPFLLSYGIMNKSKIPLIKKAIVDSLMLEVC